MRKLEVGARRVYSATYVGCTIDPLIESRLIKVPGMPMALFEDVNLNGKLVSDHNWYPYWGAIELSGVAPGSQVNFLATPTPYIKASAVAKWWQVGFTQLCWVQDAAKDFEVLPVISPPESQEEAEWFLSRRMIIADGMPRDTVRQWGMRLSWDEKSLGFINQLLDAGWACFGNFYPYQVEVAHIFEAMESAYKDRDISHIADIAAWCNAGFPAWDSRAQTLRYLPQTEWAMKPGASY
jgi:hypothetical protein